MIWKMLWKNVWATMETINMDAPIVQAFNVVTQFYSTQPVSLHTQGPAVKKGSDRENTTHMTFGFKPQIPFSVCPTSTQLKDDLVHIQGKALLTTVWPKQWQHASLHQSHRELKSRLCSMVSCFLELDLRSKRTCTKKYNLHLKWSQINNERKRL